MAYEFSIFWFLSGFVMLLPHFICSLMLDRRSHFVIRSIAGILLYAVAAYFTCFTDQWNDKYYLLLHLAGALYLALVSKCSLRMLVYFNVWCIALYYLGFQIRAVISILVVNPISAEADLYFYMLVTVVVIIALTVLFIRALLKKDVYSLKTNHVVTSVLISASIIAINTIIFSTATEGGIMLFLFQVFTMICSILAMYMLVVSVYSQQKSSEAEYIEHMWRTSKRDYELKAEYIDLINHKYHDLKHELMALKQMDLEDRQEHLQKIEESVDQFANLFQTGNEYLDTILNEIRRRCDKEKIMFSCVANCGSLEFMDLVDMYILLGNILDNAFEATRELPEENRVIDIKLHTDEHFFRITEKNTFQGALNVTPDGLRSSKPKDGYHGFGSHSMKFIVNKYNGQMAYDVEDNVFILHIIIPITKAGGYRLFL